MIEKALRYSSTKNDPNTIVKRDAYGDIIANNFRSNTIVTTGISSIGQFRAITKDYGLIIRNDNGNSYLLVTKGGDPHGCWSDARPLIINNATGICNINGKAATADKLATQRTIALSGSVTGSGVFDGSGNLTINTKTTHTHSYLPLSGGTLSGPIMVLGESHFENSGTGYVDPLPNKKCAIKCTGGIAADNCYTSQWFRSTGNNGWYNDKHGIGICAFDRDWVRATDGSGINNPANHKGFAASRIYSFGTVYENEMPLSNRYMLLDGSCTMNGAIKSSLSTTTHIAGNQGRAIINSTAPGSGYNMLAKMNSKNGVWTMGNWDASFNLFFTNNTTINANANGFTKRLKLLDEQGNSEFPGKITSQSAQLGLWGLQGQDLWVNGKRALVGETNGNLTLGYGGDFTNLLFGTKKIYHQGFKPTPKEIGAIQTKVTRYKEPRERFNLTPPDKNCLYYKATIICRNKWIYSEVYFGANGKEFDYFKLGGPFKFEFIAINGGKGRVAFSVIVNNNWRNFQGAQSPDGTAYDMDGTTIDNLYIETKEGLNHGFQESVVVEEWY